VHFAHLLHPTVGPSSALAIPHLQARIFSSLSYSPILIFSNHSMRPPTTSAIAARSRWGSVQSFAASSSSTYGRTAAYRRLSTASLTPRASSTRQSTVSPNSPSSPFIFLRSEFLPQDVLFRTSAAYARHFSSQSTLLQQAQKQREGEVKDEQSSAADSAAGEQGKEGEAREKKAGEESGEQKEGAEEGEGDKKEKKDAPPPPPHGDKTPWQVFTETLKSEFQASKEWNESTKQLSAGVNDFTQNPRVQKARTTYNKVTDAAASTTTEALKSTAKAVGTGAAWTWDTMPVKGVRKVANVTGSGVEYITRPVRQSKAFQAVKDTVDDGSSSRYGGWTEKEERKKRRELRELNELQKTGGKKAEPMVEDPE
jgi:mitochondrial import inner membrane translocase subunit TIM44